MSRARNEDHPNLFGDVSELALLRAIRKLPKVDLHRHLTGCIGASMAIDIAIKHGIDLPTYISSDMQRIFDAPIAENSLIDYLRPWALLNKLFASPEATRDIVVSVLKEAAADGIVYAEMRVSPRGFLGNERFGFEAFLDALADATSESESRYGITARWILGLPRHIFARIPTEVRTKMLTRMIGMIAPLKEQLFVGVDLDGDECSGAASDFTAFFKAASRAGFGITVHAGEIGPASHVQYAIENLGASRIGHGLAALRDPGMVAELSRGNCAFEICPTSNIVLGAIKNLNDVPIKILRQHQIRFAICTDNPARCRTSLSEEIFKVAVVFHLSEFEIRSLMKVAIDLSFANPKLKSHIESMVLLQRPGEINGDIFL